MSLEDRCNELENNWKRAVADYRNLERRTLEERQAFASMANTFLLSELLPVLDAVEAAANHVKDEGLTLATKKFVDVLKDFGVAEMESLGKKFDAATMEALEMVDGPENEVVAIGSKGYLIGDKILRAAKVKVGNTKGGI
ncbi:MAG: nucleotide exchange factor GrpE [candidate division WWE3 bacterium]|nr:nucleotide exchange factor GrpE [candidate division WWE3 bacterium]